VCKGFDKGRMRPEECLGAENGLSEGKKKGYDREIEILYLILYIKFIT
jgi:hypothetical protein